VLSFAQAHSHEPEAALKLPRICAGAVAVFGERPGDEAGPLIQAPAVRRAQAPGPVRASQLGDHVFALQQQRAQIGLIPALSSTLRLLRPVEQSHAGKSARGH
jgi:hypothetical protein